MNLLYLMIFTKSIVIITNNLRQSSYLERLTATSYFADLFPYISYFGSIGLPGTGKSTDIETEGWITYRAMKMTNPSSAQIVRLFGNVEPGQYTLIVDEADNIDKDSDLMPMIKEGYRFGATAQKVNDFTRKLDYYYPYSMKFWAPNMRLKSGKL